MSILVVTGTGTDVGKTVVTAALAACAAGRVAVVKPAQTGVAPGEGGDLAEVTRLSGCSDVYEWRRYPDALSPHHAATASGLAELGLDEAASLVAELEADYDLVLVEGAGGALVPYDNRERWTILDLASRVQASVLVVAAAGLGTVNHTTMTVNHVTGQDLELAGIVIGSWPVQAGLAERYGVFDLARLTPSSQLAGVLSAGMAAMGDFAERAHAALAPQFGGTFDWPAFRAAVAP